MDFDSPDVEKDFPGLYASEKSQSRDSDYSDNEKSGKKDLLGKKREKRESKKDKGYAALGESSGDDDETKSPGKSKKSKSTFKLVKDRKEKHSKKEKDFKDKKEEKEKLSKKESKEIKKECKDSEKKDKTKKKKEHKLLRIKDKKKKSIDQELTGEEEKPIFGVPLHVAVERSKSHDGIEIPVIVRECIDYIEEHGLACESIYKISGLKSKVRQLKSQYNKREKVYLYEHEPHIVASLLKQFLRDLPEPILTSELAPKFEEAAALKNEKKRVEALQKLLGELPNCNRILLSWIFVHMLHVVRLEKRNKMNIQNVSIVLSPTLHISHNVLQALFAHSDVIFKGVEIKKYVPPIELDSSRLSLELPDSPSAIADELNKQENILNNLHEELNTGVRDQDKEEKLWEIQRVVTQLKRKLRFLRQVQDASNSNLNDNQSADKDQKSISEFHINSAMQQPVPDKPPSSSHAEDATVKKEMKAEPKVDIAEDISKSSNILEKTPERTEVVSQNKSIPTQMKQHPEITNTNLAADTFTPENSTLQTLNSSNKESIKNETDVSPNDRTETTTAPQLSTQESKIHLLPEDEATIQLLLQEEKMLQIQTEELMLLGDELRRKVLSEKMEIERLKSEIQEYQQLYIYKRYSFDSTENSSSESDDSSDSDEEEQMSSVLEDLIRENKLLEAKNMELTKVVQQERERCLNIKVQLKMLQQSDLRADVNYRTRM